MNLRRTCTFLLLLVAGYLVAAIAFALMVRIVFDEELPLLQEIIVGVYVHVLAILAGYAFARSQMKRQGW